MVPWWLGRPPEGRTLATKTKSTTTRQLIANAEKRAKLRALAARPGTHAEGEAAKAALGRMPRDDAMDALVELRLRQKQQGQPRYRATQPQPRSSQPPRRTSPTTRTLERLPASYKTLGPGLHSDGGNLYLQVSDGNNGQRRRSWIFRYQLTGRKRRDMGLGSADTVTLKEAREVAREYRKLVKDGIDPIGHRNTLVAQNLAKSAAVLTFDQAAEKYISQHRAGWRNVDHANQWTRSLKTHASPVLGRMSVADIETGHIVKVLDPIWNEKTETANRVRGRIEAILDWATAKKFRKGDNPARWRGNFEHLLPSRDKVQPVKHHPALPYAEMSIFIADLRKRKGMAALALEAAILTCVRAEDIVKAKHADVDRAARIWAIPSFTKTRAEHKIPLSPAALAVFEKARKIAEEIGGEVGSSEFAFPNDGTGHHLTTNALLGVIERMGRKGTVTTHGFRAVFRTWAQEETSFPYELCEMVLGHKVGTKVERAYARGNGFKKRIAIMRAWGDFCAKPSKPKRE